jgi:hypothetical protein
VENINEQVIELELREGLHTIPDRSEHLFMDILTDEQQMFPFSRENVRNAYENVVSQRDIDEYLA